MFWFAASTPLHRMVVIRLLLEVLITLDAAYLEAVITACWTRTEGQEGSTQGWRRDSLFIVGALDIIMYLKGSVTEDFKA